MLVTVTFILVTALAMRRVPSPGDAVRLALLMLPLQFTIGVVNDVADADSDALSKPYKPIPRGSVSLGAAIVCAALLAAIGVAAAASFGMTVLLFTLLGFGAGIAYDLGLRRTVLSPLAWWGGMLMLPLTAFAAAGRLGSRLWPIVPLTLLLALALLCANGLPDVDADRHAGRMGFTAVLGRRRCIGMMAASTVAGGALGLTVFRPAAATTAVLATGLLVLTVLVAVIVLRARRPFPALAISCAAFAVAWLAGIAAD